MISGLKYESFTILIVFVFSKVELFLFLSWMLHKFTFLAPVDGSLPDLRGKTGFSRYPADYKIRVVKR